jgi:hypothetical protein
MTVVLNGARGSLRSKLHADLGRPMLNLVEKAACKSKENVLRAYTKALVDTDTWPVEIKSKSESVSELHAALDKFNYEDPHQHEARCTNINECGADFDHVVRSAVSSSRRHFDGLCLGELPVISFRMHMRNADRFQTA